MGREYGAACSAAEVPRPDSRASRLSTGLITSAGLGLGSGLGLGLGLALVCAVASSYKPSWTCDWR